MAAKPPPVSVNGRLLAVSLTAFTVSVALIDVGEPYYALAISIALLTVAGREALRGIDLSMPAILALMYMVFGGLSEALRGLLHGTLDGLELVLAGSLLSQLVSNVPATILLLSHTASWRLLAVSVNMVGSGSRSAR